MTFYGRDWWHHTEVKPNAEDGRECVSITGTLTDENNYDGMIEELSRECSLDLPDGTPTANLGKRIHLTPGVCKRIGKCFDTWREDWSKEEGVVVMSEEMGEEMGGVANTVGDEDDGESEGEEVEDDDDEWDED